MDTVIRLKRSIPYELDWETIIREELTDPRESEAIGLRFLIRVPNSDSDPSLVEQIIFHECVEIYTGSHQVAFLLELYRYGWVGIRNRWKFDKLSVLAYPYFILGSIIISLMSLFLGLLSLGIVIISIIEPLLYYRKEIPEAIKYAEEVIEKWKSSKQMN